MPDWVRDKAIISMTSTLSGADALIPTSVSIHEQISYCFQVGISVVSQIGEIKQTDLLNQPVCVTLRDDQAVIRYFHGIVREVVYQGVERGKNQVDEFSKYTVVATDSSLASALKGFVDDKIHRSLPESLAHSVDIRDFELRLKSQETELAAELIECFESLQRQTSSFNFSGFDILNEVFGKFLADSFIDEKELGQYLTPPEVVRFMAGLAIHGLSASELETICDPKRCSDFGLILDPSCGVASFLAEFVHQ